MLPLVANWRWAYIIICDKIVEKQQHRAGRRAANAGRGQQQQRACKIAHRFRRWQRSCDFIWPSLYCITSSMHSVNDIRGRVAHTERSVTLELLRFAIRWQQRHERTEHIYARWVYIDRWCTLFRTVACLGLMDLFCTVHTPCSKMAWRGAISNFILCATSRWDCYIIICNICICIWYVPMIYALSIEVPYIYAIGRW